VQLRGAFGWVALRAPCGRGEEIARRLVAELELDQCERC